MTENELWADVNMLRESVAYHQAEAERMRTALRSIFEVIQKDGWWWDSAPSEHQEVISEALSEAYK